MSSDFSVIARRGFQSQIVGYYDTFPQAADAIASMRNQGGVLGFHIGYDILYKDEAVFWKQSYAENAKEVIEVLDDFGKLEGMTYDEKFAFVRAAMEAGTIVANGEYVGMLEE